MLARVALALAPCVLCLRVLALAVALAVDGVVAALVSAAMLLLVRLRPDRMLAHCGCVLRVMIVDLLGGVLDPFDCANTPTRLVEIPVDRLDAVPRLTRTQRFLMMMGVPPPLRMLLVVLRGVLVVDLQGVGGRGVKLQRVARRLTLRRGIRAVLYVGIRGGMDTRILEGWVGEVGGPLLRLRVLDSWCPPVVIPRVCRVAVLGVPVYCRGLRSRLPRRT